MLISIHTDEMLKNAKGNYRDQAYKIGKQSGPQVRGRWAYLKIISTKTYVMGTHLDGSFEHRKHMFKLGKKINTILSSKFLLIWIYEKFDSYC